MITLEAAVAPQATESVHHPAIQAALAILAKAAPAESERAGVALAYLLRQHNAAQDQPAWWNYSKLTGGGFPVEFAFTTADNAIRYTADSGGPATPPADRLSLALSSLRHFGEQEVPASIVTSLHALQREGTLRYGAWFGGRHTSGGDRYKLYCEVPSESCLAEAQKEKSKWLEAYTLPSPQLGRAVQLRMIGYEAATQRLECYFRVPQLAPYEVRQLLQPLGLEAEARRLLAFLEESHGYRLGDHLPGGSVGFSYSGGGKGPASFTLFHFARALWGGDSAIRLKMGQILEQQGCDPAPYLALSAPLADRNLYQSYHGMVGLTVVGERPVVVSVGLRPPLPPISHAQ